MKNSLINEMVAKLFERKAETIKYSSFKNDGFEEMDGCKKGEYNSNTKEIEVNYFPNLLKVDISSENRDLYQIFVTAKSGSKIKTTVLRTEDAQGIGRMLSHIERHFGELMTAESVESLTEQLTEIESGEEFEVTERAYKIKVDVKVASHIEFAKTIALERMK